MRVFLDTNVLVSAFASRGLCADLLRHVLREHRPVLSQLVLEEFTSVFRDKLNATEEKLEVALAMINRCEILADATPISAQLISGEADAVILGTAVQAEVDFFVTGDKELLGADDLLPIPVVSPRRFYQTTRPTDEPDSYPDPIQDTDPNQVSEPKENPIRAKSFAFSLEIVKLFKLLQEQREYVISKQVLRSATSIGALIEESTAAESRRDFVHKLNIASKEARETHYWLRILDQSDLVKDVDVSRHLDLADELIRMLTAIVKTTALNTKHQRI